MNWLAFMLPMLLTISKSSLKDESVVLQAECARARHARLCSTGRTLGRGEDGILQIFSHSGI